MIASYNDKVKTRILKWNRDRNSLAFNTKTEIKMLSEEANEFFMADTVEDRLREAADFVFVWEGTVSKFCAYKHDTAIGFSSGVETYKEIEEWSGAIREHIKSFLSEDGTFHLLPKALKIVLEANEAKPTTKNAEGKVIKGDNYVDPIAAIRELINESKRN